MKNTPIFLIIMLLYITAHGQNSENKQIYSHKGYFNATDIGFLVGSTDNQNKAPFSFIMVNGYGITDQLALGIGVGAEFMSESYLPLIFEIRYYFRKQDFSPFIFVHGGYSFALDKETNDYQYPYIIPHYSSWSGYYTLKPKGGWLINPGVGIKNMLNNNLGMSFSVGYRIQRLNYDKTIDDMDKVLEVDINRLEVKIGIFFK